MTSAPLLLHSVDAAYSGHRDAESLRRTGCRSRARRGAARRRAMRASGERTTQLLFPVVRSPLAGLTARPAGQTDRVECLCGSLPLWPN